MSDFDYLGFVIGDPRLSEDERRLLYEIGRKLYGERDGGFEATEILIIDEADRAYSNLRKKFDPLLRGELKAKKTFEFIINQDDDAFSNLENLNKLLLDCPIDSYILMKLMALFVTHEKKVQRSLAAMKGHLETYELRKQAIDYWRQNIDPKISNDKAASLLEKIVPVSHRKLSQYVAEAKRENLPLASKVQ